MSITTLAKKELGARIVGHDDIVTVSRLDSGNLKTNLSHTILIPPSTIEGDTRCGVIAREDTQEDVPAVYTDLENRDDKQPKPRKAKSKRKNKEDDNNDVLVPITVNVNLAGLIPVTYASFDIGTGCICIETMKNSWIPPVACRAADGSLSNIFEFDLPSIRGKLFANVGLEFTRNGNRNIILIEVPNMEG